VARECVSAARSWTKKKVTTYAFLILANLPLDAVIGMDILQDVDATILCRRRALLLLGLNKLIVVFAAAVTAALS
jgi:hypothetical protein